MLNQTLVQEVVLDNKIVERAALPEMIRKAEAAQTPLEQYLIDQHLTTEADLHQAIAKKLNLPFIDLEQNVIDPAAVQLIPENVAQKHHLVGFAKDDAVLKIATTNPEDLQTLEFIRRTTGLEIALHYTTPSSLHNALTVYHQDIRAEFQDLAKTVSHIDLSASGQPESSEQNQLKKLASELPIIKIVDTLLQYAIIEGASDIHIEPTEQEVIVRYRIDGILQDAMNLPLDTRDGIIARIKVLSNLKIDEKRLPQDGRFKILEKGEKISFRVSALPVYDGEKVVLRLLHEGSQAIGLEKLGWQPEALEVVQRNIKKPHGLILVTGPTGSGKTTTLYTIVQQLNTAKVNICTIEDPIEYRMPRINQSQVNPKIGFSFAAGLRALLRQDPDIIMVGEIRDEETAEIAINAAMTGHLVLSTLHTNDAATTLPRLADMQVPAFLIASTTNIVIAQRLVRKICSKCITTYTLDAQAIAELKKQFAIEEMFADLQRSGRITADQTIEKMNFSKGQGCAHCHNSGYKGRIGIYEVLEITPAISALILQNAGKDAINAVAREHGMVTILEDGFMKVQQGITTIEEVLRVTKE